MVSLDFTHWVPGASSPHSDMAIRNAFNLSWVLGYMTVIPARTRLRQKDISLLQILAQPGHHCKTLSHKHCKIGQIFLNFSAAGRRIPASLILLSASNFLYLSNICIVILCCVLQSHLLLYVCSLVRMRDQKCKTFCGIFSTKNNTWQGLCYPCCCF